MATVAFFHAHPDDECMLTGGTMAKLATAGHRVVLVSATRGEHGEVADGVLAPGESLGERRTAELQAAKLAVQLRTLEIEKLKLPDRQAAADAIRPLFGATGPANRAARTAARGAGSRQSR